MPEYWLKGKVESGKWKVVFFCLPPNLTLFIGIGLWLKTGPSIHLGFGFGTFFTTGFPGLVFSNSLTGTFGRLCCKTLPTRFPALPWPVSSPLPSTASPLLAPFPTLTNGASHGIFSENMWLPKTEPTWSYFLKHSKISLLNSNVRMGLTIGYWCYELTFWTPWFRRWGLVEPLSLSTNIPAFNSNTVFSSSIFDIAQLVGSNGFPQ